MSDETATQDAVVVERTFEAPIELVWQMWTQPEHFQQWYGPDGFRVPTAEMDVRVGGKLLICMASPDGSMSMWSTGEYVDVSPFTRLVYTEAMADAQGNKLTAMPDGSAPVDTTVTVVLEAVDGGTKMTMTHAGVSAESGAAGGWSQAFGKMATYLETLSA